MPHAFSTNSAAIILGITGGTSGLSNPISSSLDVIFNLASSTGVRDRPALNYEFNRNISVNMK